VRLAVLVERELADRSEVAPRRGVHIVREAGGANVVHRVIELARDVGKLLQLIL
jgi:hypothetical protein